MSKTKKITTGLLSFLPFVLIGLMMAQMFHFFKIIITTGNEEMAEAHILSNILPLFILGGLAGLLSLGLLVYFIIHCINNRKITDGERIAWILVFVFASIVGFPIYWYLRIWQEPPPKKAAGFTTSADG